MIDKYRQRESNKLVRSAEKHIVSLPVSQQPMSPVCRQNYDEVPYQRGVWKTRDINPIMAQTLSGEASFNEGGGSLPRMRPQKLATAEANFSPRHHPYERISQASQRIRQQAQNEQSAIKLSVSLQAEQKNFTQRNKSRRYGQKFKASVLDEQDSIYQNEKIPMTQRTHRATTLDDSGTPSLPENEDSLFLSRSQHREIEPSQQYLSASIVKATSIYSKNEQLMVKNILNKHFKGPRQSQVAQAGFSNDLMVQQNSECLGSLRSSDAQINIRSSQQMMYSRKSQDPPRHLQKQKFLMERHAFAKLSKQSVFSSNEAGDSISVAANQWPHQSVQTRQNAIVKRSRNMRTKLIHQQPDDTPLSIQMKSPLNSSRIDNHKQLDHTARHGHHVSFQYEEAGKIIPVSLSQRQSRIFSHQSPRRHSKDKSPPKNFIARNTKNLFKSIEKLHPQFPVFDRDEEIKSPQAMMASCESSDAMGRDFTSVGSNDESFDNEELESSQLKRYKAAEEKKNLIEEVSKRMHQQSSFNANDILQAAGISNHRQEAFHKMQDDEQRKISMQKMELDFSKTSSAENKAQSIQIASIITSAEKIKSDNALINQKYVNAIKMVGKSKFQIPNCEKLEQYLHEVKSADKRIIITGLASGEAHLEGKITLKDYDKKMERVKSKQQDPIMEHVKKFSGQRGMNGLSSEKKLPTWWTSKNPQKSDKVVKFALDEHNAKQDLLLRGMTKIEAEESVKNIVKIGEEKGGCIFNRCLEEETNLLGAMGKKFIERVQYMLRFSQREVEHEGKGVINEHDPNLKYFLQCQQDLDLALPILEKVCRKTLLLQEYTLSPGHCRGLAQACRHFDHLYVNRVFLNNCGIDDGEFSSILEGLNHLKDFKSIVYKANLFGEKSLSSLEPLLRKRVPNHLEELTLIDCHMNSSLVCRLVDLLIDTKSQLTKLRLINANHSENSFLKICQLLEESENLQELDLSWSKLSLMQWRRFMNVIKDNRRLVNLNISYNRILEPQPLPTSLEPLSDDSWNLTPRNLEVVNCLKVFIKYNVNLVSLNLENTGMNQQAIIYVVGLLRRSQALRCLHLSANEGITANITEWVRKRIHAKDKIEPNLIKPYQKMKKQFNKLKGSMAVKLGEILFLAKQNKKLAEIRSDNQWINIREGMKLRHVIASKRMNEVSTYMGDIDMEGSFLAKTLVINRILGSQHILPGSAQWVVHDDKKSECWKCSQQILTIFLWSPSIGALTCDKDPMKLKYYKDKLEGQLDMDNELAKGPSNTPLFASSFNGWRFHKMQLVVPYCMENDLSPPHFLEECVADGLIKPRSDGRLSMEQKDTLQHYKEAYYQTQWQEVLLTMMRYKKPQIANAQFLTNKSLKYDVESPVYIYTAWVPPGRHTYCVSHDPVKIYSDGEEGKADLKLNLMMKSQSLNKAPQQTFYVHEMLSTFRQEDIPFYHNPRHVHRIEKNKHQPKQVFQAWTPDSGDVVSQMLSHDKSQWNLRKICETDKEFRLLESVIVHNFQLFTDTYHYLQTQSDAYPWVSHTAAKKYFFTPAITKAGYSTQSRFFDIILTQASFANRRRAAVQADNLKTLNRAQFIELVILLARELLADKETIRETNQEESKLAYKAGTTIVKATQLFVNLTLKKFLTEVGLEWQSFRDTHLWQNEVKLIFTMNQTSLKAIFGMYEVRGRGQGKKDLHFQGGLLVEDVQQLIIDDSMLLLTQTQVKYAFVMSKMTVVEETSPDSKQIYNKLVYVEFLEFLGRIAQLYFEGSEMEDLELHQMLEYLLDELLPIVGAKQVKQSVIIEEFSESDDDY